MGRKIAVQCNRPIMYCLYPPPLLTPRSSYGKGFGIIGPLLGEDSFLNVSNAAYGILLYIVLIITGECTGLRN